MPTRASQRAASETRPAPGQPGIAPTWTSSAKSGVGTARSRSSELWFTLHQGIVTEVYYPDVDLACTRDMGLIITDGHDFFSEEKRDATSAIEWLAEGVPGFRLTNTCRQGRYQIRKEVLADPRRSTLLQWNQFTPLAGDAADYRLHVLLAPHLGDQGGDNSAWVGEYKGWPMLMAARDRFALALACSAPFSARSVGYVGVSDGWQDLQQHKRLTWHWTRAENGNVALVAEIDFRARGGQFVLSLGFGHNVEQAAQRAVASLQDGFAPARKRFIRGWQRWQARVTVPKNSCGASEELFRQSMAVMRVHRSKRFQGGVVASLSEPWGFDRGDKDRGGYHVTWPRDLVEMAGAMLAGGENRGPRRIAAYLQATQEPDGHWPQNMWLDGSAYWGGLQLDETAQAVMLVNLARRVEVFDARDLARFWPMVRRAAGFIVAHGPATPEDRWEENGGYSSSTLPCEIAALLAAADLAELHGAPGAAAFLRDTADAWHEQIDGWLYATGTPLAERLGLDGYYVRLVPAAGPPDVQPWDRIVELKNRPRASARFPAWQIVSPDALALVRFGLRQASDPRIVNTVRAIDALLKVETPGGPAWHRYTHDGYGEQADGTPFDGYGIGRAWPLLTGERGHYELSAGRHEAAQHMLAAVESFASPTGLLPEQVWDSADMPEHELFLGRASGSAMPLVWAHAEYVKLRRSLQDGRVFDMPCQTVERYLNARQGSSIRIWRVQQPCDSIPRGKNLRIDSDESFVVQWGTGDWHEELSSRNSGLGLHFATLPTAAMHAGGTIEFRLYCPQSNRWQDPTYRVTVR